MKTLAEFTWTTLVGGVLILLPIYLAVLLLAKTLSGVTALLSPVTALIPAAAQFREVLAILIVIAACFVAGLLVRTGPGGRGISALQRDVLQKIPGYNMLRSLVSRVGGRDGEEAFAPAPVAGALYVLPAARVHRIDVPLRQLLVVYSKWGQGTGDLIAAMRKGA